MTTEGNGAEGDVIRTLAIDIGGTGIKAMVLDNYGHPLDDRIKEATPHPAPPEPVIKIIKKLAEKHRPYDRVSVGFPGVVRNGITLDAPNLDDAWEGFDLQSKLTELLEAPTRVANDADVQGFGAITGKGVELVLTLGTGLGSALFVEGILFPNLELAHHPFRGKKKTYEDLLGKAALEKDGRKKWQKRLEFALKTLQKTFNCDKIHIGGGNASKVTRNALPENVRIVSNVAGLLGGIALWNDLHDTDCRRVPPVPADRAHRPIDESA
ncbi:Polyphosphate glucokinase [Planctomycetes bacterium Pan216]|uniref:Polyphosphate glucokinase n=1 Tax=Kolteria novifilia TaxID=2527975 RepID=A0A518B4N6_9BACT|nr:Polyphosphate glucokinase [Planctomycetes bacterium Pan216]